MSEQWDTLREALTLLAHICTVENQALVELNADRLAPLQVQKAETVRQVARCYKAIGEPQEGFPEDIRLLAERCQRLNAANKQMLVLTLRCMDSILSSTRSRGTYGPGLGESSSRIMDLRV
jgi:hypothetical protein